MTNEAPRHLKAATRRWYQAVVASYDLEDHHRMILEAAAGAWDRYTAARVALDRDGMTYTTAAGYPKTHPLIAVERDSRLAYLRAVRELGLDVDQPSESRAPIIHGNHARRFS